MNKILIPCDFSETSNNAMNYAIELAKKFIGRFTIIACSAIASDEFGIWVN